MTKTPIKKPAEAAIFERLVAMVQLARKVAQASRLPVPGSKRDACATIQSIAESAAQIISEGNKAQPVSTFVPSYPIRNQLARFTADSPDLFAVIKQEGGV